ncbi:MAG: nitrous oxide reductase accessory protein NosL [Dissulfurispiraceae bacterium]
MKPLGKFTTSFAILSILILTFSVRPSFAGNEASTVEDPKTCAVCGMDRNVYAHSRMLIVYADGTTVGLCSLHCAAEEMNENKSKQVKSIMVADYATTKLIDAKTAIWVIGGSKAGVMSYLAEWAFAEEKEAQAYVKEYGGKVSTFEDALKAAEGDVAKTGPMKQQMLFHPAFGDEIYHTHPAGMWMVNTKFMYENMSGLRAGNNNIDAHDVGWMSHKQYNYMMIPTYMDMYMYMLMVMYGVTDDLTLMVMANYQTNNMQMLMNMGMGKPYMNQPIMQIKGISDTELRGLYKINNYLVGSLGLSMPSGSINKTDTMMGKVERAPYDMQLGSGTWDLKPALTYNDVSNDAKWNWGAQVEYTWRTAKNDNDWKYGDIFKATSWLQRAFGPATTWVRLAFSDTGRISGQDPQIQMSQTWAPTPDGDPSNYGGQRLDGLIGVSIVAGRLSFGVEGGIPLYQYLNGLQLKTRWVVNAGIQAMF